MKYADLFKESEKVKRKWIYRFCNQHPERQLSYVPMLTDKNENLRQKIVDDFMDDFTNPERRKISNPIQIYHDTKRYGDIKTFGNYSNQDARDTYFACIHPNNTSEAPSELLFLDPDSGFYAMTNQQKYANARVTNDRNQISMIQIEVLLNKMKDNSIIACYQHDYNDAYTKLIEDDIREYLANKEVIFKVRRLNKDKKKNHKVKIYTFMKDII